MGHQKKGALRASPSQIDENILWDINVVYNITHKFMITYACFTNFASNL